MNLESLYREIEVFSKEQHGSTNYYKEEVFVKGQSDGLYAPLKYLDKKSESAVSRTFLYKEGFVCDAYDLYDREDFCKWYEGQFSRKLKRSDAKRINIIYMPDNKSIFDAIELVNKCYEILRDRCQPSQAYCKL